MKKPSREEKKLAQIVATFEKLEQKNKRQQQQQQQQQLLSTNFQMKLRKKLPPSAAAKQQLKPNTRSKTNLTLLERKKTAKAAADFTSEESSTDFTNSSSSSEENEQKHSILCHRKPPKKRWLSQFQNQQTVEQTKTTIAIAVPSIIKSTPHCQISPVAIKTVKDQLQLHQNQQQHISTSQDGDIPLLIRKVLDDCIDLVIRINKQPRPSTNIDVESNSNSTNAPLLPTPNTNQGKNVTCSGREEFKKNGRRKRPSMWDVGDPRFTSNSTPPTVDSTTPSSFSFHQSHWASSSFTNRRHSTTSENSYGRKKQWHSNHSNISKNSIPWQYNYTPSYRRNKYFKRNSYNYSLSTSTASTANIPSNEKNRNHFSDYHVHGNGGSKRRV